MEELKDILNNEIELFDDYKVWTTLCVSVCDWKVVSALTEAIVANEGVTYANLDLIRFCAKIETTLLQDLNVKATDSLEEALTDADFVVVYPRLISGFDLKEGRELTRTETLIGQFIFLRELGQSIDKYCSPKVRVIMMGPYQSSFLQVLALYTSRIPMEHYSGLTRNYAAYVTNRVAEKLKAPIIDVTGMAVFGENIVDASNANYFPDLMIEPLVSKDLMKKIDPLIFSLMGEHDDMKFKSFESHRPLGGAEPSSSSSSEDIVASPEETAVEDEMSYKSSDFSYDDRCRQKIEQDKHIVNILMAEEEEETEIELEEYLLKGEDEEEIEDEEYGSKESSDKMEIEQIDELSQVTGLKIDAEFLGEGQSLKSSILCEDVTSEETEETPIDWEEFLKELKKKQEVEDMFETCLSDYKIKSKSQLGFKSLFTQQKINHYSKNVRSDSLINGENEEEMVPNQREKKDRMIGVNDEVFDRSPVPEDHYVPSSVKEHIRDDNWLFKVVSKAATTEQNGHTLARSLSLHMRAIYRCDPEQTSALVRSLGQYGITPGFFFSFPVTVDKDHNFRILDNFKMYSDNLPKMQFLLSCLRSDYGLIIDLYNTQDYEDLPRSAKRPDQTPGFRADLQDEGEGGRRWKGKTTDQLLKQLLPSPSPTDDEGDPEK